MKSHNPSASSGSNLSDSNFVSNHPFIWGNIALIAGVPWLLAWSMAGLAVGDPVFPAWLEILLLGFPSIALGTWLQWQQPFFPFSLWFVAKPPEDLSENERRVLTLIKQQRNGWYVTGWIAIAIAFVMSAIFCKIYMAAPLAQAIAPFPASLRLFGIVWAEACFLLSNILLQSGVSALRIKLTTESELANLKPFAVEKIKNSFTTIGWRSPEILKFFEDEPEVPTVVIDKPEEANDAPSPEISEEPKNTFEDAQNDSDIPEKSQESLEQTPESLIEIQDSQDSQIFEDSQESETENLDLISDSELSLQETEVEDTDLISESEVSDEIAEESLNLYLNEDLNLPDASIDSSDEVAEILDVQPEESSSDEIANIPEPVAEAQVIDPEIQDIQVETAKFVYEPEAIAQPIEETNSDVEANINAPQTEISNDSIEIDLVDNSKNPELVSKTEEIIAEENISGFIDETVDRLEDGALLSSELTEPSVDDLEVEVFVSIELAESTVDELEVEVVVSTEITEAFSELQEQQELSEIVNELITEEIVENCTIAEELIDDLPEQLEVVESENILVIENDLVDQVLESSDSYEQELTEPVDDTTVKVNIKAINFLKKARKKGFAQKNYGFGKSVKTADGNTNASETMEIEETEVDSYIEESQVDEIVSEASFETSDTIFLVDADEESKSTEDIDLAIAEESIEAIEENESIDFDDELDELVVFNIYVENILNQYLDEPSGEITEMGQDEQVEDQKPEEQEVEDIIEISAVSEQATEIAEEILISELIQEEESSNQEVEEIVEIAAISQQASEIAEEVLISEDNLENAIPEIIEVPIETGLNDLNNEAIAPEEEPKYLVQESLVDQFLARIEELNIADKTNKANLEKDLESAATNPKNSGVSPDEIDEFADLEALLNNNPLTDESKE